MKIRLDFVTNSSSSSFIFGVPNGNTVDKKKARKYIERISKKIGEGPPYFDFMIDLRYRDDIEYEKQEISFVLGAIYWYLDDINEDDTWYIDGNYEYHDSLPDIDYNAEFNRENIKRILDYAYKHLGEVLIGNDYREFYTYEFFEELLKDDKIKFKCNHMG